MVITKPQSKNFKCLNLLVMLYLTIMLISIALVYKLVYIGGLTIASSSLILPLWYIISDVIAEVYGYKVIRQIIWFAILCEAIFIFLIFFLIQLPSPEFWGYQNSFNNVFGKLPRVFLGSFLGIMLGNFMNVYILSKWKMLLKGKYFWLRSLGSSAIGEAIFTMVTIMFDYLHVFPLGKIIQMIALSYTIKMIGSIISIVPASFITPYIKKIENVDVYDHRTNFNPFKLSV